MNPVLVFLCLNLLFPGAPLAYFTGRGGGGGSGGVCSPKNFFWDYERCRAFLCWEKKAQRFFGVLYFSLVQINNNIIDTFYCWCGIFLGMLIFKTK